MSNLIRPSWPNFTLDNISIENGEKLVWTGFTLTAISQQMNLQAWEREQTLTQTALHLNKVSAP